MSKKDWSGVNWFCFIIEILFALGALLFFWFIQVMSS